MNWILMVTEDIFYGYKFLSFFLLVMAQIVTQFIK
jgi:hypothetical protein